MFHLLLYQFLISVFGMQCVFLLADNRRCEIIREAIWARIIVILDILIHNIVGSLSSQLQITLTHGLSWRQHF